MPPGQDCSPGRCTRIQSQRQASSSMEKLFPDHEGSTRDKINATAAMIANPAARTSRELVKITNTATSHTTASCGTATQARAAPVCTARYCWMVPRKPGISTIVARCANLNTTIASARMKMFRARRNRRLSNGFGSRNRRTAAVATRNSPVTSIATTTPEFIQQPSRRSTGQHGRQERRGRLELRN